jgi:lysophospholipase L1-like esterase
MKKICFVLLISFASLLEVNLVGQSVNDWKALRFLPVGDSLTQGCCIDVQGGYRSPLRNLLGNAGFVSDFIGTQTDSDPALSDKEHEGHPGYSITMLRDGIGVWLKQGGQADVVLLLAGTVDIWTGSPASISFERLKALVEDISFERPNTKIIISNLIPRTDALDAVQVSYNQQIPGLVAELAAKGRNVSFLDMRNASLPGGVIGAQDLIPDGVHPNLSGYEKMAAKWLAAISTEIDPQGSKAAPAIAEIDAREDLTHINVIFNKPIRDEDSVPTNFSISDGVSVLQATLDPVTKRSVRLTTAPRSAGAVHVLGVSGVRDRRPEGNTIPIGSQRSFATPLLVDGSFEKNGQSWVAIGDVAVVDQSVLAATNGLKWARFNSGGNAGNGSMSQSFATTPGKLYRAEFDLGARAASALQRSMRIRIFGTGEIVNKLENLQSINGGDPKWSKKTIEFTADSALTTIRFEDTSAAVPGAESMLDDVRVMPAINWNLTVNVDGPSAADIPLNSYLSGSSSLVAGVSRSFADDDRVDLNATDQVGDYRFASWKENGTVISTSRTVSVRMHQQRSLVAIYVSSPPSGGPSVSDPINAIANGGFESGSPVDFGTLPNWEVLGNIGAQPVGFTATEPGFKPAYVPQQGLRMALFSAGNNDYSGAMSQAFATVPGTTYLVKLKMGIVTEAAGRRQALQVSVTDDGGASILSRVETIVSPGSGTTWIDFSASFVAAGTQTRLNLSDQSEIFPLNQSYNSDLLIDGVSVTVQKSGSNPPTANPQVVSVTQDDYVQITLIAQDQDPGNVLTYRIVSGPSHGTIGGAPPNIVYTPSAGYLESDSFSFAASDGFSESVPAVVIIDVKGAAPMANGGFELGDVADFGTVDGWRAGGKNGSLPTGYTRSAQGVIPSYSPSEGNRMLVFSAGNNDFGGSLSQRFATVAGKKYQLMYDMGVVSESAGRQQALAVSLYGRSSLPLINRTEVIQSAGAYSSWVPKVHEFLADGPNVLLTFLDQSGSYAQSSTSNTDLLLDNVRIVPVSEPVVNPTAKPQSVELVQNGSLPIVLMGSSVVAGSQIGFQVTSAPLHGVLIGNAPNLVYTPNAGFSGADQFEFVVIDGSKQSQPAKIAINVIKKIYKFDKWMATFGASGGLDANPDKDSIVNGTEYVLGTNPVKKTGSSFLPKSRVTNADPDGDGKKSRYLVFSYRRTQASASDPDVSILVEWRASAKEGWKKVASETGVIEKNQANRFAGGVDLVSVHIPRTITKSSKLFTRLRVVSKQ